MRTRPAKPINPARYKVLHLGCNNHLYNLGGDRLSSSPAENEILLDTTVNKSHEWKTISAEETALCWEEYGQQTKEVTLLSLGTDGPTPGILHSILDVEILETVQQRADGMARGLQWSGASKDRLRELCLFSLTEEAGEWSNHSLKYLKDRCKVGAAKFFHGRVRSLKWKWQQLHVVAL